MTSLLAITALMAAKHFGAVWMDPAMGVGGGALVARWAWGLVKDSGAVLLDRQAPPEIVQAVRNAVESDSRLRVADLHVWSIGPGYRAAILSVKATHPCQIEDIEELIPDDLGIAHMTIEIRRGTLSTHGQISNPAESGFWRSGAAKG